VRTMRRRGKLELHIDALSAVSSESDNITSLMFRVGTNYELITEIMKSLVDQGLVKFMPTNVIDSKGLYVMTDQGYHVLCAATRLMKILNVEPTNLLMRSDIWRERSKEHEAQIGNIRGNPL